MTLDEQSEWMGITLPTPAASRGMYTHVDLNRVESAVSLLSTRLRSLGYEHPQLVVKTDWTYSDDFLREDMVRYLGNISTLRECIPVYPETPNVPTIGMRLTYSLANDIEKILEDIDDITSKLVDNWYYPGELYLGEV
jgi:hypothetical protein